MAFINQIECFNIHIKFYKFLGIWPSNESFRYYHYYSKIFISIFIFIFVSLHTINFYFMPRHLDTFVEELLFYFTEVSVASKALTFVFMFDKIKRLLDVLQSDMFQPTTEHGVKIIEDSKKFNARYWRIMAGVSLVSNLTHVLSPLITHLLFPVALVLPVSSYSLFPTEFREAYIYPIYFFQALSMHFHMWYNVNIDTFFLGLMIFTTAQLDILHEKLRNVTNLINVEDAPTQVNETNHNSADNIDEVVKLKQSILHFYEVSQFCSLIQQVFSVTLFLQFSIASGIICVCLFRFTLPAPWQYYIFLGTYIFLMIIQIMVPCWIGSRIMDKSYQLAQAVYDCDWTSQSRRFKSNLRIFVERASRPLSITGLKMFPLSLVTFTSIMKSAYSFFTLLRHMQTRQ